MPISICVESCLFCKILKVTEEAHVVIAVERNQNPFSSSGEGASIPKATGLSDGKRLPQ
jgi:hypothetical protein